MQRIATIVTFVLLALQAVAQTPAADTLKPAEPKKLQKKVYSVNIPTGWRVSTDCKEEQCSLFSPADTLDRSKGPDKFVENLNITVNKLNDASYTALKYANYSIEYLPKVVKGFKVLQKKKLGATSYRLIYQGEKNGYFQTWQQDYHVRGGKVYILTFAAETPKFDRYLADVTTYMDSFKFN